MKALRTLLALVVLLAGACSACSTSQLTAAQPTADDAIKNALQATVVLFGPDAKSMDDLVCAGERVDHSHIVTAYHCAVAMSIDHDKLELIEELGGSIMDVPESVVVGRVGTYAPYSAIMANGDNPVVYGARIVKGDPVHDLALLQTDYSYQPSVKVARYVPAVGAPVFSIGHPAGLAFTYAGGWVSTPCRYDERLDEKKRACWMQVDITIHGGSSGGGLYNEVGELIGVASTGNNSGDEAFFVPTQIVADFVSGR